MVPLLSSIDPDDHCRIGSLEMLLESFRFGFKDHCRIGSLETTYEAVLHNVRDHCRIGSLEK